MIIHKLTNQSDTSISVVTPRPSVPVLFHVRSTICRFPFSLKCQCLCRKFTLEIPQIHARFTGIVAEYFSLCKRITYALFLAHSCNAFGKNGNLCGRSLLSFNTMRASPKTGSTALGRDSSALVGSVDKASEVTL